MKRTVILVGELQRRTAAQYLAEQPLGNVVTFSEPKKKRIQEEKYHAQIGDISAQTLYAGKHWGREDMKRLMIDEFADAMRQAGTPLHMDEGLDSRITPSEDGTRVIQLGIQSREFWVKEASQFIEFLYAWGADRYVKWTEAAVRDLREVEPA